LANLLTEEKISQRLVHISGPLSGNSDLFKFVNLWICEEEKKRKEKKKKKKNKPTMFDRLSG